MFLFQIKWENRYHGDNGSACRISVDGTDFRILEPSPFDAKWYSHKFKGAGLRYEIGISIQGGDIVWCNGPFPCGTWSDLKIAKSELHGMLDQDERYIADRGYRNGGVGSWTPDEGPARFDEMKAAVRARHETVNGRFKRWAILNNVYRHDIDKHEKVMWAVLMLTQAKFDMHKRLYKVDYADMGMEDADEA